MKQADAPVAGLDEQARLVFPFDRPVTAEEWNSIVWPPCPRCGAAMSVKRADVTTISQRVAHYIPGWMACPNECDWTKGSDA